VRELGERPISRLNPTVRKGDRARFKTFAEGTRNKCPPRRGPLPYCRGSACALVGLLTCVRAMHYPLTAYCANLQLMRTLRITSCAPRRRHLEPDHTGAANIATWSPVANSVSRPTFMKPNRWRSPIARKRETAVRTRLLTLAKRPNRAWSRRALLTITAAARNRATRPRRYPRCRRPNIDSVPHCVQ